MIFMQMASYLSALGTCCRLRVGCILLRSDGGIASGGYNGSLPGMEHCTPKICNPSQRCLHTSHAEENALGFCSGNVSVAYITAEPCLTCTRMLARRGVKRVVFAHPYTSISEQEAMERQQIIDHYQISWEKA